MEALIVTKEEWPWFKNPNLFSELQDIAEAAFQKANIEGYLSSVLIYQQLTEEMSWILLKDCQFLTKIALSGVTEIHYKDKKGMMFGRLLENLSDSLEFKEKNNFISECNKLNKIRIELVHGLAEDGVHQNISKKATTAQNHFKKIKSMFMVAHKAFLDEFTREKRELISIKMYE
jgi:hypothetical protein